MKIDLIKIVLLRLKISIDRESGASGHGKDVAYGLSSRY